MNRSFRLSGESPLLRMTVGLFLVMAVIRVITALVHFANLFTRGYSPVTLMDGVFNLLVAGMAVLCSGMLTRRRLMVMPAFIGLTLVTLIYAFSQGRGISFGVVAVAAFFLLCLWVLRRRRELS